MSRRFLAYAANLVLAAAQLNSPLNPNDASHSSSLSDSNDFASGAASAPLVGPAVVGDALSKHHLVKKGLGPVYGGIPDDVLDLLKGTPWEDLISELRSPPQPTEPAGDGVVPSAPAKQPATTPSTSAGAAPVQPSSPASKPEVPAGAPRPSIITLTGGLGDDFPLVPGKTPAASSGAPAAPTASAPPAKNPDTPGAPSPSCATVTGGAGNDSPKAPAPETPAPPKPSTPTEKPEVPAGAPRPSFSSVEGADPFPTDLVGGGPSNPASPSAAPSSAAATPSQPAASKKPVAGGPQPSFATPSGGLGDIFPTDIGKPGGQPMGTKSAPAASPAPTKATPSGAAPSAPASEAPAPAPAPSAPASKKPEVPAGAPWPSLSTLPDDFVPFPTDLIGAPAQSTPAAAKPPAAETPTAGRPAASSAASKVPGCPRPSFMTMTRGENIFPTIPLNGPAKSSAPVDQKQPDAGKVVEKPTRTETVMVTVTEAPGAAKSDNGSAEKKVGTITHTSLYTVTVTKS